MSISQLQFASGGNLFASAFIDRKSFWNHYLFIRDIRPEMRTPVEITLRGARPLAGMPVGYREDVLTLHHPDANFKDFITFCPEDHIACIGLSWTPALARYFVKRGEREPWEAMGLLRISQLLPELAQRIPAELKLELKTDGPWSGVTEEDFRILEDILVLMVRELLKAKKEFPDLIAKLKTLAFKQPKGDFSLSAQAGLLAVQLPYESQAILEVQSRIADHINQTLEKV